MKSILIPLPNPEELYIVASMKAKDGAEGWILQPITKEAFLEISRQDLLHVLDKAEIHYVNKYESERMDW